MTHFSIFEILMLVCFGASWPFAVYKTYKTKNVSGKSLRFLALIILGYFCGILHKLFYHYDLVIWFYVANLVLVLADAAMLVKYRYIKKSFQ